MSGFWRVLIWFFENALDAWSLKFDCLKESSTSKSSMEGIFILTIIVSTHLPRVYLSLLSFLLYVPRRNRYGHRPLCHHHHFTGEFPVSCPSKSFKCIWKGIPYSWYSSRRLWIDRPHDEAPLTTAVKISFLALDQWESRSTTSVFFR